MLLDVGSAAEFATALCALLDPRRSKLLIADAGHPSPLLLDATGARYIDVPHGPPIGVPNGAISRSRSTWQQRARSSRSPTASSNGAGEPSTRASRACSDGCRAPETPLTDLVSTLADTASAHGHDDDLAILGVRWTTTTRN
jgi:hypothetical protein